LVRYFKLTIASQVKSSDGDGEKFVRNRRKTSKELKLEPFGLKITTEQEEISFSSETLAYKMINSVVGVVSAVN